MDSIDPVSSRTPAVAAPPRSPWRDRERGDSGSASDERSRRRAHPESEPGADEAVRIDISGASDTPSTPAATGDSARPRVDLDA